MQTLELVLLLNNELWLTIRWCPCLNSCRSGKADSGVEAGTLKPGLPRTDNNADYLFSLKKERREMGSDFWELEKKTL